MANSAFALLLIALVFSSLPAASLRTGNAPAYLDDGLTYAVIQSTATEWNTTFPGLAHLHGPLHVWLKCVDSELRGYFFLSRSDIMDHFPTEYLKRYAASQASELNSFRLKIYVNDTRVKISTNGKEGSNGEGAVFFVPLNQSSHHSSVKIVVDGWTSYIDFSLSACAANTRSTHLHRTMIVHTSDNQKLDLDSVALLSDAIQKHANFHQCSLHLTGYDVLLQPSLVASLVHDTSLGRLVDSGFVRLLLKPPRPPPVVGLDTPWHIVHYNVMILRHWGEGSALFFWDADEYWFPYSDRLNALLSSWHPNAASSYSPGVIRVERRTVFCSSCPPHVPEIYSLTNASNVLFGESHALTPPKSIVLPEAAYTMNVHWAWSRTSQAVLDGDVDGVLLHRHNLLRWRMHSSTAAVSNFSQSSLDVCWRRTP